MTLQSRLRKTITVATSTLSLVQATSSEGNKDKKHLRKVLLFFCLKISRVYRCSVFFQIFLENKWEMNGNETYLRVLNYFLVGGNTFSFQGPKCSSEISVCC